MRSVRTIVLLVLALAVAVPALAEKAEKPEEFSGEVVQVRTRTMNQGEFTEIQVRTMEQHLRWLRLGPSEEAKGQLAVGDQVRARAMAKVDESGTADAIQVKNEKTGTMLRIRTEDGKLLRQQSRTADGQGKEVRERHQENLQGPGAASAGSTGNHGGSGGGGKR